MMDEEDDLDRVLIRAGNFINMQSNDLAAHWDEFQQSLRDLETVPRENARSDGKEDEVNEIIVIGDVHGKVMPYLDIIQDVKATVCVGDVGFKKEYKAIDKHSKIRGIDMKNHWFIPGNHDDYDNLDLKFSLGDYGARTINGVRFFIIRGAESIDKRSRVQGVSWWPNEELNHIEQNACYDLWLKERPEIVISHDCPDSMYMYALQNPEKNHRSTTSRFLEVLFDIYKPKLWIFGHHHKTMTRVIKGTQFVCLEELDTMTIGNYIG